MHEPVVLCVDDEKIVINSLRRELHDTLGDDFLIETAESGEEAIDVFQEFLEDGHEIPLVISDQIMPGMKGHELFIQLHPLSPQTLNIMLTGQADLLAVTYAVNHAALYRYIPKPWEKTDLALTVKEALHKYFQAQKLEEQRRMLQEANRELAQLNEQLQDYSRSLEQKVAERTAELERANKELRRMANLDGLTRLANRRRCDEYLQQEWLRLSREKGQLALIMCDIDHFKAYNDNYGHQAGDECLKQVATALKHSIKRPADLVARYGGEEFIAILPNTEIEGLQHVAHTIQQAIRELAIKHSHSAVAPYITMSIGMSTTFPRHDYRAEELVEVADQALYQAKSLGRNRIVFKPFE